MMMMNSVMATISSLILLLALGFSACQASLASAYADGAPTHVKHNQNQVEQQQQQPASSEQLAVGQLLKFAASTTGDQGASMEEKGERRFEELLARGAKRQQLLATKPSKKRDAYFEEKDALKRKWHKLVDQVFDSDDQKVKFAVNEPQARKRNLLQQQAAPAAASASQDDSNQDERLAVILIKRKPQLAEGAEGESTQPVLGSNNLADLMSAPSSAQQQQQQQQQQQRAPINMADHQRRLSEDGFGILRQSKFTTNNQLGDQGVPKFGSDEQF